MRSDRHKFMVHLTKDDWDTRVGAWACSVLRLPGAEVNAVYVDSAEQDRRLYSVDAGLGHLKWSNPKDPPTNVALTVNLSRELADKDELDREHKRQHAELEDKHRRNLLIVMLAAALITAAGTIAAAMWKTQPTLPTGPLPASTVSAPVPTPRVPAEVLSLQDAGEAPKDPDLEPGERWIDAHYAFEIGCQKVGLADTKSAALTAEILPKLCRHFDPSVDCSNVSLAKYDDVVNKIGASIYVRRGAWTALHLQLANEIAFSRRRTAASLRAAGRPSLKRLLNEPGRWSWFDYGDFTT